MLCVQSAWLDRESCGKCYMVAARAMGITWGDAPQYWRWIPHADSRFASQFIPAFFSNSDADQYFLRLCFIVRRGIRVVKYSKH